MAQKILFNWSSGKDSALALHKLIERDDYTVEGLISTVTRDYKRVSMHGLREEILKKQAELIGIPLEIIYISSKSTNEEYEQTMKDMLMLHKKQGIGTLAFGDIFLEDLREYREENLSKIGMKAVFPLWKRDTSELAREFMGLGFKAVITCVDSEQLDKKFAGREFDEDFLADIPADVDPCGENGEFHTFVYDGPVFKRSIHHKKGEIVLKNDQFYFCDVILNRQ